MTTRLVLDAWSKLGQDAQPIRVAVFIQEQHVPVELEWDEMDAVSLHAVAYDAANIPVGTGRLLPDGHIGRMAVSRKARGNGVGSAILRALMAAAQDRGDQEVALNAQLHAEAFYARFGFVREGDVFPDAGIPHIHMRYRFSR